MTENNNRINTNLLDLSILVVDDELANVTLLSKLLDIAGYSNVICTQDPCQVLPLYQEHKSDLILLDINMPVLDGFGVMQQLNEFTHNSLPPIIVLTAQHMQEFKQRALDSGARDYVTKPFDTGELLSRVRNMLEVQMAHKFMQHQNEILEYNVEQRTKEIAETRLQIVRHLGRAAEYRDNETGLHVIRMSKMAILIAQSIGLDKSQCDLLLNAAPMHDIGKIGIPDHILLKPGKLDANEWEIMKTHSAIGHDVFSDDDSDLILMAKEIAISHHEKWNGSGYPKGLKGDAIPLMGRITALADVFDALTSERPYKKAWSIEKASNYIQSESGVHFDPTLVEHFVTLLPELTQIVEKYTESKE